MSRFPPDELRTFMGGQWISRAPEHAPAVGIGTDSREDLRGRAFIALRGERFDGHDHLRDAVRAGASVCVVDRAITHEDAPQGIGIIRVDDTRKALGRLAHAYRRTLTGARVISVTGSAGKTTTKSLIHAVLSSSLAGTAAPKSFNNDIGVPLTILSARRSDRYLVLELGMNAPGEIAQLASLAEPDIAVITNVGHAHVGGFSSLADIAREKASLLRHVLDGGLGIVNADQHILRKFVPASLATVSCGESVDADLRLTARGRDEDGWWLEINQRDRFRISLPGLHNAMNALFAIAVGRRFALRDAAIREALANAQPPAMRMTSSTVHGVHICNDTYNANPESVRASIDAFLEMADPARGRHLILGDMLELGSDAQSLHEQLGRTILRLKKSSAVHHVYLIGDCMRRTAVVLADLLETGEILWSMDIDQALMSRLASMIRPGDALLVKASRGMRLERFIDQFQSLLAIRDDLNEIASESSQRSIQSGSFGLQARNLATPSI